MTAATVPSDPPGPTALVGSTGFVGGALSRHRRFDVEVGSRTSGRLAGRHFGEVVFCAARAEKWRANADPELDRRHLDDLRRLIDSFTTERMVLISTVDVFAEPVEVDESSSTPREDLAPYGANRLLLEEHVRGSCAHVSVVRLPGLFGRGLKKNVVFDLLHGNAIDQIDPRSGYQYYDLSRLADDLDRVKDGDVRLVHLVTEPVRTDLVARSVFGLELPDPREGRPAACYDVRTRHAELFGSSGAYVEDSASVLGRMRTFVSEERGRNR